MPFCTNCGHDNPTGSNFCARCGQPVAKSAAENAPEKAGTPAPVSGETTKTIPAVADDGEPGDLSGEDQAAIKALPQGSAILIVRRGETEGSRFLLDSDLVTAGRKPDGDIFLDDITVSRRHAELRRTPEGTVVHDLGSLNGTYINRKLINSDTLLQHGDELQIGKYRLVYYPSTNGLD